MLKGKNGTVNTQLMAEIPGLDNAHSRSLNSSSYKVYLFFKQCSNFQASTSTVTSHPNLAIVPLPFSHKQE